MKRNALCLIVAVLLTSVTITGAATSSVLTVTVTMGPCTISDRVLQVARREVSAVWAPYGVAFAWPDNALAQTTPSLVVQLICADDELSAASGRPADHPLGAVFRAGKTWRRVIVISPAAVLALVRASMTEAGEPTVRSLFGRMVGQVIAHELGHLLLDSSQHSHSGLMRQTYTRRDVLTGRREPFQLQTDQIAKLTDTGGSGLLIASR